MAIPKKWEIAKDLIKSFEGYSAKPYLDSVNVPTIGYGFTYYPNGNPVKMSDPPLSAELSEETLLHYIKDIDGFINKNVRVKIHYPAMAALISLIYNIGKSAFLRSSIYKALSVNDQNKACDSFLLWVKAGGSTLPGLVHRRYAEMALFASGQKLRKTSINLVKKYA